MSSPGTLRFGQVGSKPSSPPVGYDLIYVKTDDVLYIQDSSGIEVALGSASSITSLTGDVSAVGPGSAVATVNFVGGQSAANVASATAAYLSATNLNTPSTLVFRDSSGNFSAGTITANITGNVSGSSSSFTGSLSGDVTGTQSATSIASTTVTGKLLTGYSAGTNTPIISTDSILIAFEKLQAQVSGTTGTAITALTGDVSATGPGTATATVNFVGGQTASAIAAATATVDAATSANTASTLVLRDASGNFSAGTITASLSGNATTATTAVNFTGSLSGDVTGTQSATVVSLVGGKTASDVASATATVDAATSANTASTLVLRDASGNFSAGTITASLSGNATTATTAVNFTGSLSGDVTGTQSATSISSPTVTGKLLTGYTTGTNTPIIATNSILTAFENLQAQISATTGSAITSLTGDVNATGPGAAAATVTAIQGHSVSTTAPTDAQILIYNNTASKYVPESIGGDASLTNSGVLTLDTVNSNIGTFASITVNGKGLVTAASALSGDATTSGSIITLATVATAGTTGSSTSIPSITINAKGLVTSVTGNAVVAPAGTLSGTTLASNVVNSSLTSVGTIISGVWNGTALTAPYMLALPTADIYVGNGSSQPAAVAMSGDVNIISSGAATIQPNVVGNSKLAQAPANTLKGNNTGSTANVTDLTVSQVNTILGNVTTVGTYDSQTSQANGLDIVGNTLYAQSANITNPGMVNITTQSFAGNKTFTGTVAISPSYTSALTINTTSFIFDSTNNALGIGLQPATSVMIDGINTSASSKLVQMTGYGIGSTTGYRGRFARGTVGSPTAVQSGDVLSAISGRGYGASQFATASTGVMNIVAGETFTNTSNLTYLQFSTTPTGSVTSAESMRIATTGVTLGPQTGSTAIHQINGGESNTTNTITASTYAIDSVTTDYIVYTDSTSNTITITLPVPTNGRTLLIEDKTGKAGTNSITVNPHASEKINGASNIIISQPYGNVRLTSDGTNWFANTVAPSIYVPAVVALTESGGATTINWAAGNMFTLTLNANLTISFSNAVAGQTIVIRLTNTASNYTVVWTGGGLAIKWPVQTAPVMTTGAFSDVYTVLYDGSNYFGSYVQNF